MLIKLKSLKNQVFGDAKKYFSTRKYLEKTVENYQDLPEHIFNELKSCFILSTGRCGTELLVKLFQLSNAGKVVHEPKPQLVYGSKIAHELSKNSSAKELGFITARYDILRETYLRNQFYIETNNRITFFADAIYDLMPGSKFIHLVRHPGDFVRSGIRRKYYSGHDYDDGRLTPIPGSQVFIEWQNFSQIKKVGWL
ncbi:MAG: hypothetical protein KAR20_10055, partial [Candidatus Heimdallarchaeota archaeon]|nr:hypothetical protein [Candidatus Heimdallarchaeota archaeon]